MNPAHRVSGTKYVLRDTSSLLPSLLFKSKHFDLGEERNETQENKEWKSRSSCNTEAMKEETRISQTYALR